VAAKNAFFDRFNDIEDLFNAGEAEKATAVILENVFELERGDFHLEIMPVRLMNRESGAAMALQILNENQLNATETCEFLAKNTVPTLVIIGDETNPWWRYLTHRYHECSPGSEVRFLEGVNHDGPLRDPMAVVSVVLDFVQRHQTAEP